MRTAKQILPNEVKLNTSDVYETNVSIYKTDEEGLLLHDNPTYDGKVGTVGEAIEFAKKNYPVTDCQGYCVWVILEDESVEEVYSVIF